MGSLTIAYRIQTISRILSSCYMLRRTGRCITPDHTFEQEPVSGPELAQGTDAWTRHTRNTEHCFSESLRYFTFADVATCCASGVQCAAPAVTAAQTHELEHYTYSDYTARGSSADTYHCFPLTFYGFRAPRGFQRSYTCKREAAGRHGCQFMNFETARSCNSCEVRHRADEANRFPSNP